MLMRIIIITISYLQSFSMSSCTQRINIFCMVDLWYACFYVLYNNDEHSVDNWKTFDNMKFCKGLKVSCKCQEITSIHANTVMRTCIRNAYIHTCKVAQCTKNVIHTCKCAYIGPTSHRPTYYTCI